MKNKYCNKQLLHNVLTFLNNYINNDNIHYEITKGSDYICSSVFIMDCANIKDCITSFFITEDNFNEFKQKVINMINFYERK